MAAPQLDGAAPRLSVVDARASTTRADAAIARVLAAEREARTEVADCALQAEREVQDARDRARAIQARGAARGVHAQRAVERALASLQAQAAGMRAALAAIGTTTDDDAQRLTQAVERLADELTRGGREADAAQSDRPQPP